MWYLIFYHIVSCFSTNRKVNKHHNSHCLKQVPQTTPVFLTFESIQIYFATTPDEREIAEWSNKRSLQFLFWLLFDFQSIAFWTTEVRFPPKAHSFHYGKFSLIRSLNPKRPITDRNHYLRSNICFCRFYVKKPPMIDLPHCASGAVEL